MDATIDDIYNLPFMKMLNRVTAEIMLLRSTKDNTMTDDERRVFNLYRLVSSIMSCVDSIRMSMVFSKRYNKQYLLVNQINEEQYTTYHYDSIIHKKATIKDLEFKIIHLIYNLPVKNGKYSWKTINANKQRINNPQLFFYYEKEEYKKFNSIFVEKRHKSIHDGNVSMFQFKDVSSLIWLRDLGNNPETKNITGVEYANGHVAAKLIKDSRKQAVKDMKNIYRACLDLRYMFFWPLFPDLKNLFTSEINAQYGKTISEIVIEIKKTSNANSQIVSGNHPL